MIVDIIKIGNSQGIRIPKTFLKRVGIDNKARLVVENGTIVILPEDEMTSRELTIMSEPVLIDWNSQEEDKAWDYLKS